MRFLSSGNTGSGEDFDAFVDQRAGFVGRGFAVDRTMLDIAVVHLARFVGKRSPTVSAVCSTWSRSSLSLARNSRSCAISSGVDADDAVLRRARQSPARAASRPFLLTISGE